MKKRLFTAIGLPEKLKEIIESELGIIRKNWPAEYPIRFTPADNLHITVNFLGYQNMDLLKIIETAVEEVAAGFSPIKIRMRNLVYGPSIKSARMIWLNGESKNLELIKKNLEDNLTSRRIIFNKELRPFNPHITLARFNFFPRTLSILRQNIDFSFISHSINLMESRLTSDGPIYSVVKKFEFYG